MILLLAIVRSSRDLEDCDDPRIWSLIRRIAVVVVLLVESWFDWSRFWLRDKLRVWKVRERQEQRMCREKNRCEEKVQTASAHESMSGLFILGKKEVRRRQIGI